MVELFIVIDLMSTLSRLVFVPVGIISVLSVFIFNLLVSIQEEIDSIATEVLSTKTGISLAEADLYNCESSEKKW